LRPAENTHSPPQAPDVPFAVALRALARDARVTAGLGVRDQGPVDLDPVAGFEDAVGPGELPEYADPLRHQVDFRMQRQDARGGQCVPERAAARDVEPEQGLALRQGVDHFDGDRRGAHQG
jgi:hypothetical protein